MKTAKKVIKYLYLILLAICELWLIAVIIFIPCAFEEHYWYLAIYIPVIIVALPISSLLHELGHKLFGAIVKIETKLKFSLTGSSSCKIIPKTDKNLRAKIIFTTIGGLAVNLITVILCIIPFLVKNPPLWLLLVSLPIIPASFFLFAFNAFPHITGNGKTDGLVIYELIKNDDNAKVMIAVLTVQAQVLKGKPIEEVDEKLLFDLPVIQEDDPAFISLTELRYEYYKAKGDEEQTQKYRERLEELKKYYLFEYLETK